MPRRYYTRYRSRRFYGQRRKWSPTLTQGSINNTVQANTTGFQTVVLCENSANVGTSTPVSTIIKAKNFKVIIDAVTAGSANVNMRNNFFAIMYLPQGYQASAETPTQHPEWIMAWRTVDVGYTSGSSTVAPNFQMSSRLTRNLNSGDRIVLYNSVFNANASGVNAVTTAFYVSFVTCNN